MAEREVALIHELSTVCARIPSGEVEAWSVLKSMQRDGIYAEAIYPAPGLSGELTNMAEKLSVTIASKLGVIGVLAVKLFETVDVDDNPEIFVNELTVRPYSISHWSQGGCETSQFRQHLRAAADLPLESAHPTVLVTVVVNILDNEETLDMLIA